MGAPIRLFPKSSDGRVDKSVLAIFLRAPFSNSGLLQSEIMESTKNALGPESTTGRSFPLAPTRAILTFKTLS